MKRTSSTVLAGLLLLLTPTKVVNAQTWYISPGFKLGYVFGAAGGFTPGIEFSITYWPQSGPHNEKVFVIGGCVSIESLPSMTIAHFGLEAGGPLGLELGPSYTISGKARDAGIGITVYGGVYCIPYFRYTSWHLGSSSSESGTFLKLPNRISGPKWTMD
jgi:hypothetical protein